MFNFLYIIFLAFLSNSCTNFAMEQGTVPPFSREFEEILQKSQISDDDNEEDDPARSEQDDKDEEEEIKKLAADVNRAKKRKKLAGLILKDKLLRLQNRINGIPNLALDDDQAESYIDKDIANLIAEENKNSMRTKSQRANSKNEKSRIVPWNWSYKSIGSGIGILALIIFCGFRIYHANDDDFSAD